MSTADYIRGLEEGAHAMHRGPLEVIHAFNRVWFRHKGVVLLPGDTEIRLRTFEEWTSYVSDAMQRITGHNRLRETG